jgi:transcriptional regulator with XRE-family HTH domain
MGMKAIGEYFRCLREHQGLTLAEVARRVNAGSSQIFRIEKGQGETRATLVAAVAQELQADPNDVIALLADEQATPEQARARVAALQSGTQISHPLPVIRPEILALLRQMDDFQLGRWVAMGERIINEK